MTAALYSTIWISLGLFVAAQHGYRATAPPVPPWVHWANAAGLLLCAAHIGIAMGGVHGWNHTNAIAATALQTESVFGWRWGGGVFVNYLFVIIWTLEAWWRTRTPRAFSGSGVARWVLRTFYAVVVFNAAVVFARGSMRAAGAVLVAGLLLAWRPHPRSKQRYAPAL